MREEYKNMVIGFGVAIGCVLFAVLIVLPYKLPWWVCLILLIGLAIGLSLGFAGIYDLGELKRKKAEKREKERMKSIEREERKAHKLETRKSRRLAEREEREREMRRKPHPPQTSGLITDCRIWKCPKCGEILEKGGLGSVWMPSEPVSKVSGTGSCHICGSLYPQSAIYGGTYDVRYEAPVAKSREIPADITLLVFRLRSFQPPSDPDAYCKQVLVNRFPRARMQRHFVAGNDGNLTISEAIALYQDFKSKGQLEDLGKLFDSFEGKGPSGDRIVALFFS